MVAARAVAGFALQLSVPEGAIGIGGHGMLRAEDGQRLLIVVARKAGVGALAAIAWLIICRLRGAEAGNRNGHEEGSKCQSSWLVLICHVLKIPADTSAIN